MTAAGAGAAESLPPVVPGSIRYFVLLYCPRNRRRALATLLAVADEIDAGRRRDMDHAVAHLRLDWWRAELQRFRRGEALHPWLSAWLREQPQDRALELEQLTEAAAVELASARLSGRSERRLGGTLFVLAAQLLGVEVSTAPSEPQLRALGSYVAALERDAMESAPAPLDAQAQAPLTPLLVWVALAERHAARRTRTAGRFAMLADNFIAWRSARRAQRGRFRSARTAPSN